MYVVSEVLDWCPMIGVEFTKTLQLCSYLCSYCQELKVYLVETKDAKVHFLTAVYKQDYRGEKEIDVRRC